MKSYIGKINNFLFRNEENGYAIGVFSLLENEKKTVVIKGSIALLRPGIFYKIEGEMEDDAVKKTKNFIVSSYQSYYNDKDHSFLIKFLSSSLFPTVGKILATSIVDACNGEDVLKKIDSDPDMLINIKNIKPEQISIIKKTTHEILSDDNYESFFVKNKLNLRFLTITKNIILDTQELKYVLEKDFYNFAYNNGLTPFNDVDEIVMAFGMEKDSSERVSWIAWSIVQSIIEGKTKDAFISLNTLQRELLKLFPNITKNLLNEKLVYAKEKEILYFKSADEIYTRESYEDEQEIAKTIINYIKDKGEKTKCDFENTLRFVEKKVSEELGIPNFKYNVEQRQVFVNFLENNLQILTGGPGTGKTTVIIGLMHFQKFLFNTIDSEIAVVAPTGRAASRIKEHSSFETSTIHRLLKYNGGKKFTHTAKNPLYKKMLIIDESSMIEQHLFAEMLRGIKGISKIIIVGDVDQLPSVGYGNVFEDLIKSNEIIVTHLVENNRQDDKVENGIIKLANAIKEKKLNEFDFFNFKNLKIIDEAEPLKFIKEIILQIIDNTKILKLETLQVVAPMYNGNLGIIELNNEIQKDLIDTNDKNFYSRNNYRFFVGDKIIYEENSPEKNIYNGDLGIIQKIVKNKNKLEFVEAMFNDRVVKLSNKEFDSVSLAYACSIHKTQGSEYENVILVLDLSNKWNYLLLNNKTLYTAITRAKKNLYLVSSIELFTRFAHKEAQERHTGLTSLIHNIGVKSN